MDAAALAAEIKAEIAALPRRDTPNIRKLRRRWSACLAGEAPLDLIALGRTLATRMPQETKWVGYELVRFHRGAYEAVGQAQLEAFAEELASWYAVDGFGTILSGPLWAKGRVDDGLIDGWASSPSRWLRRSALVATVGLSARSSRGAGDAARTLKVCRALAADRDDMVEKALSWALRALSPRDRSAVEAFMAELGDLLPARDRREVRSKLTTGKKTPRASGR